MNQRVEGKKFILPDGRTLGYQEYGPSSSKIVFHFHGSAGSRFERPADISVLEELGVRFISIDRPGHGLSDFQPGRKLLNWADDVNDLADHLGISKFYVMGLSAGGPHALACAYKLDDKVMACAVVSGLAPPNRPKPYKDLPFTHRIILFIFRNFPRITNSMRKGMYSLAQGDVVQLREKLKSGFPPADKEVLETPENMDMMIQEIQVGYGQGWDGPAQDDTLINIDWGFNIKDIPIRVDFWHGLQDQNIPYCQSEYQHGQVKNSKLYLWQDLGHLGLLVKWHEVILRLTNAHGN